MKNYRIYDIGNNSDYFDEDRNKDHILKLARESILPTNKVLLDLFKIYGNKFKVNFSISGIAFDLFEKYVPEVLESFNKLLEIGSVEFISQTYYGTLDVSYSKSEFLYQFKKYNDYIKNTFGLDCRVFKNSQYNYTKDILEFLSANGFEGVLLKSKNLKFNHSITIGSKPFSFINLDSDISNLIENRFSDKTWDLWPFDTKKFTEMILRMNNNSNSEALFNLSFDYMSFGLLNRDDSGIFDFLRHIPDELLSKNEGFAFIKVSENLDNLKIRDDFEDFYLDSSINISNFYETYLGNKLQKNAVSEFFNLEKFVNMSNNEEIIDSWRKLSSAKHFYFMNTHIFTLSAKNTSYLSDYRNPYQSPYEAYVYFMNILNDIIFKLKEMNILSGLNISDSSKLPFKSV